MARSLRFLAAFAAIIAAALLVSACGGEDAATVAPATDPATNSVGTPTSTTTDPAAAATSTTVGGLPQGDGNDVRLLGQAIDSNAFGLNAPISTDGLMPAKDEEVSASEDSGFQATEETPPEAPDEPECNTNSTGTIVDWTRAKLRVNNSFYWVNDTGADSYFPAPKDYFYITLDGIESNSITINLTAGVFADESASFSLGLGQTVTIVKTDDGDTFRIKLVSVSGVDANWIKYVRTCS